jgi:serine/threonine protein kinase
MGCAASTPQAVPANFSSKQGGVQDARPLEQDPESFFDKYTLGGKLGKGGFAQVRALTVDTLAVKIMDLRSEGEDGRLVQNNRYRKEAVEEAGCWRAVGRHTNIVGLQDAFLEHGACFFVMERCSQTFQSFLSQGAGEKELNQRAIQRIFREVLSGVAHVHSCSVVHRDLKPDNVMVNHGVCKLCDFGLAGMIPSKGGLTGVYGTAPFMCPEMLLKEPYKSEADVWSIGVMMYVFCFGGFPYVPEIKSSVEMKKSIKEGKVLPTFTPVSKSGSKSASSMPRVSQDTSNFVRELLNRDQAARISAADALQLDFMRNPLPPDAGLLSLKPLFPFVLKCGAFENRRIDKVDGALDPLLEKLHKRYHGIELSQAEEPPSPTRSKNKISTSDASTAASNKDACGSSQALSVVSGSSRNTSSSTMTPQWRTSNMSVGGRHPTTGSCALGSS